MKKLLFLFLLAILWAIITPFLVISLSDKEENSNEISIEEPFSYYVSEEEKRP